MPEVRVKYRNSRLNQETLEKLSDGLGRIIAEHLGCTSINLSYNDISLSFLPYTTFDQHQNDLEILVDAFKYEERLINIDERNEKIFKAIEEILGPNISFFVWTRLTEGGFNSTNQ